MGLYGTILRTAIAILAVPTVLFAYIILTLPSVLALGPLLWAALIAGLVAGLLGSAIESYVGYRESFTRRLLYWLFVGTLVVYGTRWFVPIWPITLFGSMILAGVLALVESVITPKFAQR
jgi:hypothetical protein